MVTRSLTRISLAVIALMSVGAFAQTYTQQAPYTCQVSSRVQFPITSLNQFSCVSVPYMDANGTVQAQIQFMGPSRFEMFTPFQIFGCQDPADNSVWHFASFQQTSFTQEVYTGTPGQSDYQVVTPGTYSFNWEGFDNSGGQNVFGYICGAQHSGTVSGEYTLAVRHIVQRSGGSYYWVPVLSAGGVITINDSPVADGPTQCPREIPHCVPKPPLVASLYRCGADRRECFGKD